MYGSNNELIKLCIVCDQTYMFTISFWHEKCRGAPICRLRARNNYARGYVLAASWKHRGMSLGDDTLYGMLWLKKNFHFVGTHRIVVQAVRKHRRENRQGFGA